MCYVWTGGGVAESIVGRQPELAAIRSLVDGPPRPRALVIEGEAGIGKTTVWTHGVEEAAAAGYRVLRCRPGEAETRLSFAALADLVDGVIDEVLPQLPLPQRHALEVAFLLEDAPGPLPDQRAVAAAFLAVLRTLSRDTPLLLAIDNVQWLDRPSSEVLQFSFRRLPPVSILLLLARRTEALEQLPLDLARVLSDGRLHRVELGPLSLGGIHHLLRTRLDLVLPRPVLRMIHQTSAGNPFFALELGRALQRTSLPEPGERLPIPGDLHALIGDRLRNLPDDVREILLVASALSHPTAEAVEAALGGDDAAVAALERAAAEGEIVLDGERIQLAHPLPASILYATSSPGRRRRLHERIAAVVANPEERARHLALSVEGPDEDVAGALDTAADRASVRGAPDAATELSELALRLTPNRNSDARLQRLRRTSDFSYRVGDLARSRDLREQLLAELPPGVERANVLLGIAKTREDDFGAALELCEQALREAASDPVERVEIQLFVGIVWIIRSDLRRAEVRSRTALRLAERVGEPALLTKAIAQTTLLETWIGEVTPGLLERGVELEQRLDPKPDFFASATAVLGRRLLYAGELDDARPLFEAAYAAAVEQGNEPSRMAAMLALIELECRAGSWHRAEQLATEGYELVVQLGLEQSQSGLLYGRALVDAHLGNVERARDAARDAVALAEGVRGCIFRIQGQAVLGFLELSQGDAKAADRYVAPLPQALADAGYGNPGFCPVLPNAIEACLGLGDLERARSLLDELEQQTRKVDTRWARAVAARCRGLVAAAEGDNANALAALEQALVEHERLPCPFEHARTLLVLGTVQRRAKQRRAARESLAAALSIFQDLGASLWAEKARAESGRIAGRTTADGRLTASERRVAELVAEGRSNKDVAAELFVSAKTVDYHLGRIYEKLDVHSRAELAHRLPQLAEGSQVKD